MPTYQEMMDDLKEWEKECRKRKPKVYPYVVIVNKQQYEEFLKTCPEYISNNINDYVLVYPDPQDKIPRGSLFCPPK